MAPVQLRFRRLTAATNLSPHDQKELDMLEAQTWAMIYASAVGGGGDSLDAAKEADQGLMEFRRRFLADPTGPGQ